MIIEKWLYESVTYYFERRWALRSNPPIILGDTMKRNGYDDSKTLKGLGTIQIKRIVLLKISFYKKNLIT